MRSYVLLPALNDWLTEIVSVSFTVIVPVPCAVVVPPNVSESNVQFEASDAVPKLPLPVSVTMPADIEIAPQVTLQSISPPCTARSTPPESVPAIMRRSRTIVSDAENDQPPAPLNVTFWKLEAPVVIVSPASTRART